MLSDKDKEKQPQASCPFCAQNRLTTGTISYFS